MLELSIQEISQAIRGDLLGVDPGLCIQRISTDTRTLQAGDLYWALEGDRFDGHDFCHDAIRKGGSAVVIKRDRLPGIEIPSIRVDDTLWALGELAACLRKRSTARVVGITGSVGKTTTKEYLRSALSQLTRVRATEGNLNNLIGVPKTIADLHQDDEWLVLEMGIDRPGEMQRLSDIAKPEIGVVTTISEAHLERMGSIQGVFEEKSNLLKNLPSDGLAIIPHESEFRDELISVSGAPALTFGTDHGSDYLAVDPTVRTSGCYGFLLKTPSGEGEVTLRVPGIQMVYAATAAAAVAISAGFPIAGVIDGLQAYTGLPGRCEVIELMGGITLIADHYNANPVSMGAAIKLLTTFLQRRRVLIAGEMWDLGRRSADLHQMVGHTIGSSGVDFLVAVGGLTRSLVHGAREAGMQKDSIRWYENTALASTAVPLLLQSSDVVLVKGSRGMKMEGIIESLVQYFGRKAS